MPERDYTEIAQRFEKLRNYNETSSERELALEDYERYTIDTLPIMSRTDPDYITSTSNAPDNKYINAFDKEIVDTRINYALSNQMEIKYKDGTAAVKDKLENFLKVNKFDNFVRKAGQRAGACGYTGILVYIKDVEEVKTGTTAVRLVGSPDLSDNIDVRFKLVDPWEYYLVRNDDDTETAEAIRYYGSVYVDDDGSECAEYYGEYYDDTHVYYLYSTEESENYVVTSVKEHFCGMVPLVQLNGNYDKKSFFYYVKTLIDSYNTVTSDFANEMETFRQAYMILKNYDISEDNMNFMKTHRALKVEEGGDVSYLTKEVNAKDYEMLIAELKKNIERFSGHLDYSDPQVYGRATNLAISTRIKPLHTRAKAFSLELTDTLQQCFECVFNIWSTVGEKLDWKKLEFVYNFDTPINDVEEADRLVKLKQLGVSMEDIFGEASFIDDPEQALERAKKQEEEDLKKIEALQKKTDPVNPKDKNPELKI